MGRRHRFIRAAPALVACLGLAACTSTSPGPSDSSSASSSDESETGADATLPADESQAAIEAFLAADAYLGDGWHAQTDGPREASTTSSPHGRVRVYLHDITVDAQAMGLGTVGGEPLPVHAAAVKEFYDDADQPLGRAMMFKHLEGSGLETMTYFCTAEASRCSTASPAYPPEAPLYGDGSAVSCGGCHVGLVFTKLE